MTNPFSFLREKDDAATQARKDLESRKDEAREFIKEAANLHHEGSAFDHEHLADCFTLLGVTDMEAAFEARVQCCENEDKRDRLDAEIALKNGEREKLLESQRELNSRMRDAEHLRKLGELPLAVEKARDCYLKAKESRQLTDSILESIVAANANLDRANRQADLLVQNIKLVDREISRLTKERDSIPTDPGFSPYNKPAQWV
ncbi:hypothetical protein [Roseiconus lacunae]|uniref:hypothetical protein n=1 Tax=Roseiconus lacunae TaxID=2605694 RepID=UPI0011F13D6E|nr:hypothetical protein [Roseiconus lacunae]